MRWFRVHTDILQDREFRRLTNDQRLFWFLLMTLVADNDKGDSLVDWEIGEIAWRTSVGVGVVEDGLRVFAEVGLITYADETITLVNWEKRQYADSRARVKKHRDRGDPDPPGSTERAPSVPLQGSHGDVTGNGSCDVSVTPSPACDVTGHTSTPKAELNPDLRKLDSKGSVSCVFDHWRATLGHPKAVLGHKRKEKIRARLREGFTVEQLTRAVEGCAVTPHNMGFNDNGAVYDDLALILRDAGQVERFIKNADHPPRPPTKREQQEARNVGAIQDWLEKSG